jgi:hypothetical protein
VPQLFLSYREDDSVHAVIALADRLAAHFGRDSVFRDRDSLTLGSLYPLRIRRALERSDVVLALIGPSWLDIRDDAGVRRLDRPKDWVRTELRMAFKRRIPVIPVLLDHTRLPTPDELPEPIRSLSSATFWRVSRESFDSDARGLIDGITRTVGAIEPAPPGGNVQYNNASGGTIIANQGSGTQHIDLGGNPVMKNGPDRHNHQYDTASDRDNHQHHTPSDRPQREPR